MHTDRKTDVTPNTERTRKRLDALNVYIKTTKHTHLNENNINTEQLNLLTMQS